jgi:hypothetical protein
MLKNIAILVFGAVLVVACCINDTVAGSGTQVSNDMEFKGFTKVEVSSAFQVEITRADAFRTRFMVDDNLVPYLRVKQHGETLEIGMKPGHSYNCSKGCLRAVIEMPDLRSLELSGATDAKVNGFSSERLELELSGASSLRGDFQAGKVEMDLSGASHLELTGNAGELDLDASGACEVELKKMPIQIAKVDLSGASDVTLNVSESLSVDASGASTLTYLGTPVMKSMETSGASSIRQGG